MTADQGVDSASRAPLPIPRLPRDGEEIPVSFAQRRLWFLEQLDAGRGTYNIPLALRLRGALDVALLEKSFTAIVSRHEALRTSFIARDGQPMQRIHPPAAWEIPVVDLSVRKGAAREQDLERRLSAEATRPFDLAAGPLFRTALLRLGREEAVLLLCAHPIVADRWSMGVLVRELSSLYTAFHAGVPSPLGELPLQHADVVRWQLARLAGAEETEAQLAVWKGRLSGAPPLKLPTDRPRPAVQRHHGGNLPFSLPAPLREALEQVGREQNATLSTVLLAAFKVLLSRYSGQGDISVGVPIANRTQAPLEQLIGCFTNTLVLRVDLSDDPSFDALVARVSEVAREAHADQAVPFEQIVEALEVERDQSRSPLFQVMFELEDAPLQPPVLPGLHTTLEQVRREVARFDLTLSLREQAGQLVGQIEYSADLFDASTIERMMGHLRAMLEDIAASPRRPISELALLTAEERRRLLGEWNTDQSPPADACIHELFEAQVRRTPEATALVVGHERITYRALNARANQLGAYLRSRGIGPEVRVGLCVKRTAEMVVGILGVLKAGGAYVPLDPAYPSERLAYTFTDARALVLVTERSLRGLLSAGAAEVVCIDEDGGAPLAQQPEEDLPAAAGPKNLAYVLYTSGSTGRPKGVALEHRGAAAFLRWATDTFSREDLAGTLAATSIGFDLSVFELFAPLLCGGAVVLAENALALPTLPAREEVTLVNTVPSVMAELVRSAGVPSSVRIINLAGEPLAGSLARAIYENTRVRQLFNLYGPTETTTYSTYTPVARASGAEPTIGRPLRGTRAYILDTRMQPVPVGVQGELYLAGTGLARGYLGHPALTAARFVPDPFSPWKGACMYRTGDRARFMPDGDIAYLGRLDFQVKLHGFRIEPGEIEEALRASGAVRQAVVMALDDAPGDKRLVAYVVPDGEKAPSAAELRRALEDRLPRYMVPSAFVVLDSMPLTPNGKVDRKALPIPAVSQRDESALVAPRNPTERLLTELFAEVLHVDKVGVCDDFFLLGGNSMKVTRLVNASRAKLGSALQPVAVFEARTAAQLAARLTGAQASEAPASTAPGDEPSMVALQPSGSKQPLFLMHPFSGMPFAYTSLQNMFDRERPLYASMVVLEKEHHVRSFEERTAIYVREIKRIQPRGPYLLGGYSYGARLAFDAARQMILGGDEVAHLVLFDGAPPVLQLSHRLMMRSAPILRFITSLLSPGFRVVFKLEAQMTWAPPSREELMGILTSRWVPDRLAPGEARGLSLAQLADRLIDLLRRRAPASYWRDAMRFTPSWMHDGLGMWRCIKIRKLNADLLSDYCDNSQRWRYPGRITYFAYSQRNRGAQWQPYAERPIDVRLVDLHPKDGLDPHDVMFEPENVKLFVDELRQVLG